MIGFIGPINPPPGVREYTALGDPAQAAPGLLYFLNNLIKFGIVIAGIFAFINLILAGYGFMSAGDDPKKIAGAWAKIWQSLIGLLVIAGSFVLAAIFGWLLFGDPRAILIPQIYGP